MFNATTFYLLWLFLAGCLVVTVPVLGVLTLAGGLTVALRRQS